MPSRMSWPNHGYTGPVLPRPIIRSTRPSARCWSIAKSSAIFSGSLVVMRVVEVERTSFSVCAADFLARVDFRRPDPAEPLRRHVEHYWLIDWDLEEPYVSHVVPHPAIHIVFQQFADQEPFVEVTGVQQGLFAQKLEGRGR